jgi:LEA14-like dessication related protein
MRKSFNAAQLPTSLASYAPSAFLAVALVALATFTSGCNLMHMGPSVKDPKVEVKSVSMEAFSLRGVSGQMELSIANPNPVSLPLRYVEWEMSIAGDRAVSGHFDVPENLPANGAAPVSVALEVLAADAGRVVPHLAAGSRDYQLHGVLHFQSPIGDMSVGFQSDGVL